MLARNLAPFIHKPHSTNRPFSRSHWGVLWLPCPNRGIILFVNDDYSNLATSFLCCFCERVFPHSTLILVRRKRTILYKDTRVVALSEAYTQTQFINRWGRIFFSLQKDVTFGVCGVSVREQKSLARGHSVCRRISSLSRGKKRGKPWYSWLCRSIYTAQLTSINIEMCSL